MATQALFPEARFAFSCGEKDGAPVAAILNVGLADYRECGAFPWLVELEISAAKTDEQGLPTLEEIDCLNTVETQLQEALTPLGAHFVARQTWSGRRMIDFYVADGSAARRKLKELIRTAALARPTTFKISKDANWATWMPTLVRMIEPASDAGASAEYEQSVLVRIPLSGGEFGTEQEQEEILALAERLSDLVAETGDGELDGYEFGETEATLFAYGPDADRLFAALESTLRDCPLVRGATVTKRYGRHDDPAAREEIVTLP